MSRLSIRRVGSVELFACFDGLGRNASVRHAFSRWDGSFGYPSDARYEIEVDLPFPIGRLISPVEHGIFLGYQCSNCGFEYEGYYRFGSSCKICGQKSVKVKVDGSPHIHGDYWVFELHVLDPSVSVALGELLGVDYDRQLRFSCKGSWHNFRNDGSGFDVCHMDCLSRVIDSAIQDNLRGLELFKSLYPEEGKIVSGYGQKQEVVKYWKDTELRPISEYFSKIGIGCPVTKE